VDGIQERRKRFLKRMEISVYIIQGSCYMDRLIVQESNFYRIYWPCQGGAFPLSIEIMLLPRHTVS
jgi:hypothetical protein